jgi:NAD(P)-dependent dehydrogenase (short-subunit alcohol dehydrogenase family)
MIGKNVIAQRWGTCEEVADTILYMASPKASYIYGACLVVDGGAHAFTQWWKLGQMPMASSE